MYKTPITLAILTKNEANNIAKCIEPFVNVTDDIIVLDDSSTDATVPLAQSKGARVEMAPKTTSFAAKRNECLRLAKYDFVFFLDADERPGRNLISWLESFESKDKVAGYRVSRADNFWNARLTKGEVASAYKTGIVRLVNRNFVKFEGTVHEEAKAVRGYAIEKADCVIEHFPHATISEFISDVNTYSSLRADELLYKKSVVQIVIEMIVYPPAKFWYTYFIKGGFMDGAAGFAYCFIMAFHSFLVRAKLLAKTT